jgi:hypothetical protein
MRKRTLVLGTFTVLLAFGGRLFFLYGQRGSDPLSREIRDINEQIRQAALQHSKLELEVRELQVKKEEILQQERQKSQAAVGGEGEGQHPRVRGWKPCRSGPSSKPVLSTSRLGLALAW